MTPLVLALAVVALLGGAAAFLVCGERKPKPMPSGNINPHLAKAIREAGAQGLIWYAEHSVLAPLRVEAEDVDSEKEMG